MKGVQIDGYGGVEVLDVREVERPEPGRNQVLVAVRAAGINPSEGAMRTGRSPSWSLDFQPARAAGAR